MDVYSVIESRSYLSKALGLSPYRLLGNVGARLLHTSSGEFAYCVLLVVVFNVANVLMRMNVALSAKGMTAVNGTVANIQLHADFFLACFAILMSCVRAEKSVRFFKSIDDIDRSLKNIDVSVTYTSERRLSIAQLVVTCLTYIGAVGIIYYIISVTGPIAMKWIVLYWFIFIISKVINSSFASSFIDAVLILRKRFQLINKRLEEISSSGNTAEKSFQKQGLILVKPAKSLSVLSTLDHIQNIHYDLCDLTKDINSIYAFQLLFYIASVFMVVTVGLNNCFEALRKNEEVDRPPMEWLYPLFTLYILIYFAIQLTLLAMACAYTSSEANKTAIQVHKMLIDTTDDTVKADLELFSLQLLHRKVLFTACGFFPIDATLLYSIVGGVTTYLVILIQFQLAPGPDQNTNSTQPNATQSNATINNAVRENITKLN